MRPTCCSSVSRSTGGGAGGLAPGAGLAGPRGRAAGSSLASGARRPGRRGRRARRRRPAPGDGAAPAPAGACRCACERSTLLIMAKPPITIRMERTAYEVEPVLQRRRAHHAGMPGLRHRGGQPAPPGVGRLRDRRGRGQRRRARRAARPDLERGRLGAAARPALRAPRRVPRQGRRVRLEPGPADDVGADRARPRPIRTPGAPRTRSSCRCARPPATILGILSVDEPADGRRPDDEKLDLVVGVAQHAALALEHAQEAAAAERQRVSVGHLLRLTASLAERRTIDEMLDAVCHGIRDALGFEKVAVALEGEQRMLELRSTVGMTDDELARLSRVPLDAVAPLLDPALERDGVVLLERGDAQARVDPSLHGASFGRLNGRGARAWEQPRADRAAARPRGRPRGRGVGRRPARPPAADAARRCRPCGRSPTTR